MIVKERSTKNSMWDKTSTLPRHAGALTFFENKKIAEGQLAQEGEKSSVVRSISIMRPSKDS
jgi:hypothetical protein